jgi:hypothetical protein
MSFADREPLRHRQQRKAAPRGQAFRRARRDCAALYRAILDDVAEVHRRIPRERMRYALDIPYIARENNTAEILALRKAWARAAG